MSRHENILLRKHKIKRIKFVGRLLFIFIMLISLALSIYIIDKSAKDMLGQSTKYTDISLVNIQYILNKKNIEINKLILNIIEQFHK